jgi:PTH2 family peptidyl-tRNA hydrolase
MKRLPRVTLRRLLAASPVKVSLQRAPEVRVLLNTNVKMSRGKACAQAVHAALMALDVPHGRVVVLGGSPTEVAAMSVQVHDAGRTEVDPGTLTAGATVIR